MAGIKLKFDANEYVCRGCLSINRKLKFLQQNSVELFLWLLGNETQVNDFKFQIHLCWECISLLKRIKLFCDQIRRADYELQNLLAGDLLKSPITTLSSLKVFTKDDYDVVLDYSNIEAIKVEDIKVEVNLKEEIDILPEIKEELREGSERSDYEAEPQIVELERVKKPKKKHKLYSPKDKHSVTRTVFDITKSNDYTIEVTHSLNEIELFTSEKKDLFKHIMPQRFINSLKRLLDMRKQDCSNSKQSKFKCTHCSTDHLNLETLKKHWEQHNVVTFRCELCKKHFTRRADVHLHFRQSHSYVYTCKECGITSCSLRAYYTHNRELHKFSVCDHCGKSYRNKRSIEKHMRRNHLPAKCKICDRVFDKYERYQKHRKVHQVTITGPARELCYCVECDRQFPHVEAYKRHLRTAVVHKPKVPMRVPCPTCGKIFARKIYMTNHFQLFHVKKSKHYCEICDKYYITKYAMRKHKKFVHEKSEKPKNKICDICGRGFNATRTLVNHRRTHTGERPYKCTHCPAAFTQATARSSHERTQHKSTLK